MEAKCSLVVVKVKDVFEKSKVEITRVEYKDSVYLKPDSVFVNGPAVDIEWTADGKTKSSTDSLKKGCNTIIKTFKDPTKNDPGADTVVVCYSDAAPIVTVSANGDDVSADNIYTVVEKATKNDTAIYVNEKKNDIKVTVKDTASHVTKSFTVKLELDTVSVSSKEFKNIQSIADTKVTREKSPASGITTVPENDSYYKNTYTETIKDTKVTVSYYTDKKGNDVKRTVVTSDGKTKEVAVIEVSYTTKIGDKNVTISYFADASTGERVNLKTGLSDSESVLSADGDDVVGSYKVSYTYTDKRSKFFLTEFLGDTSGFLGPVTVASNAVLAVGASGLANPGNAVTLESCFYPGQEDHAAAIRAATWSNACDVTSIAFGANTGLEVVVDPATGTNGTLRVTGALSVTRPVYVYFS